MTHSEHWKTRLGESPGLAVYLVPVAKKWAKGLPLPGRMTLGPEPKEPALRAQLSRIFGEIHYRNGKAVATIPEPLRNEAVLKALAEQLGIERKDEQKFEANVPAILQRLRLAHPQLDPIHRWMSGSAEITRLLTNAPQQERLLSGLLKTAAYLATNDRPVTLSKLGSMFFNDSKFLRNKKSIQYSLLGGMVLQLLEMDDGSENREIALQQYGVIDNPATTTVTLFGPLTLLRNGQADSWIVDRFRRREIVTLNSTNLEEIEAVRLPEGYATVITSENAAPFHELVEEQPHAILVYTAGYPNAAVCRLLKLLAGAGATGRHWGDSDPDGLRIATLLDRAIETSLYRCTLDELRSHSSDLIPLKAGAIRLGKSLLKTHPDFKFRDELDFTLQSGRWLEQERWTPPR